MPEFGIPCDQKSTDETAQYTWYFAKQRIRNTKQILGHKRATPAFSILNNVTTGRSKLNEQIGFNIIQRSFHCKYSFWNIIWFELAQDRIKQHILWRR
jgi:hypothetical protein